MLLLNCGKLQMGKEEGFQKKNLLSFSALPVKEPWDQKILLWVFKCFFRRCQQILSRWISPSELTNYKTFALLFVPLPPISTSSSAETLQIEDISTIPTIFIQQIQNTSKSKVTDNLLAVTGPSVAFLQIQDNSTMPTIFILRQKNTPKSKMIGGKKPVVPRLQQHNYGEVLTTRALKQFKEAEN